MASVSISMALPLASPTQNHNPSSALFLRPLPLPQSSKSKLGIHSSLNDKTVTGLTSTALTASMMIPEVELC
ncbi:ultraviolet-B-repressible protein [Sesbania bispinosa]|nr:ultraviolet-B-repressible protein [Sesbania bispinosa]